MSDLPVGTRIIPIDNENYPEGSAVIVSPGEHQRIMEYTVLFDNDDTDLYYLNKSNVEVVEGTVRGDVLLEAKQLIEGDRNITYGEPTQNFTNIAGMWNILFAHKLNEPFTPRDVAQAMIALKQCRTITQPKRDNFVDIAGYAAIGWEAEQAK